VGRLLFSFVFAVAFPLLVFCQAQKPCANFDKSVKATYDFRPARLADSERDNKSAAMDRFWEAVKANQDALLPCLKQSLEDPNADPWFRFDGSNLLVSLDPSASSKELQIKNYAATNLDDVDLRVWVGTLARLGAEGFDVSAPGERWLAYPKATYYLPEHGVVQVDKLLGAIFIFGSMDETLATPSLLKIAGLPEHPGRDQAISLLLMQATPEAIAGLKALNQEKLSSGAKSTLREHLTHPILFKARPKPKTSREQFLRAFNDAVRGDWKYFLQLVSEVPDGEKDVVATLKPEDIPLVRKVRRAMIARANQHAAEYYVSFTQILMTMIWRPEMTK
jgi:hypothetical protein